MTLTNAYAHYRFLPISAVKDSILCSQLLALGVDLFGINHIDEDKLHNIATCEHKRLQRFANEFPHEQHLLNLQSILVSLLANLARKLTSTNSVNEFVRELSRISVLIHEIDCELAKAKRRKRCELSYGNQAIREAEEAIRLAAEKVQSYEDRKASNQYAIWQFVEATRNEQAAKFQAQARALAEHATLISARVKEATQQLYKHHLMKCVNNRVEAKIKQKLLEIELRQIVSGMKIDAGSREVVFTKALTQLKLKPQ